MVMRRSTKKSKRSKAIEKKMKFSLAWQMQASFIGRVTRGDRLLGMNVQPLDGRYLVLAIETTGRNSNFNQILDDHGHKVVGDYGDLVEALAAATSFAKAWLSKYKVTKFEDCGCEDIR